MTRTALRSCVPDEAAKNLPHAELSIDPRRGDPGHRRGTGAPWGHADARHTPRHSAPGSSRVDHATDAAAAFSAFDRGALLRLLDALCHSGDHARQPQLTQPDRLPGARFGLLRSSTEIHRENMAIEFSYITPSQRIHTREVSRLSLSDGFTRTGRVGIRRPSVW
jgi:hypothetical protein